jgi:hypothetical protein
VSLSDKLVIKNWVIFVDINNLRLRLTDKYTGEDYPLAVAIREMLDNEDF